MPDETGPVPVEQTGEEMDPGLVEFGISFEDLLPLESAEDIGEVQMPVSFGPTSNFLYEGKGYTAQEFVQYVQNYDFGSNPPNFVVLHHTYIPGISYAPSKSNWDSGEAGLSDQQIYDRRKRKLDGLKEYYRTQLGWDRGPHLFIDDRYIWVFTPMYHQGIHAAQGNGVTSGGKLNYSIGIEVIGYYESVRWPEPIANLVGIAVAAIKQKVGSFELRYQKFAGGISSHRDYNKPSCPGAAITESYYIDVLQQGWQRLQSGELGGAPAKPVVPVTESSPILGEESGSKWQAVSYIQKHLPSDSEYKNDVDIIMSYYWTYAPQVGVDPFIAACQCIFETDGLKSDWAARPKRNPAGLGVHEEGGLSFATWEESVQAHIGQLLAFALRDEEANDAQKQMMQKNPRHSHIPAEARGTLKTIADLGGRWSSNLQYGKSLAARIKSVQGL